MKDQKARVCEFLLESPQAGHHVKTNPAAVATVLAELYEIKKIGPTLFSDLPLTDIRVRGFVRDWVHFFNAHVNLEVRQLGAGLTLLDLNPVPHIISIGDHIPPSLSAHARRHIENELNKIPPNLLRVATTLGRTLFVTFGSIAQAPMMAPYKGVVPRGWSKPWDEIPGAGGGREGAVVDVQRLLPGPNSHGSVNIVIHEVLHNVDYACADITGVAFSSRPEFLRRWRETYYRRTDSYMKPYPEEAFAEFGSWYYHSTESRMMLRELYPQWYEYFRDLSTQSINTTELQSGLCHRYHRL